MDRLLVVRSVQFRPEDIPTPPTPVDKLGFSLVRLMPLSGRDATGVRANLKIEDPTALTELASHYSENTRLEWTFDIGGGAGSFSVVLRWTKFDRLTGSLQVVRTAVLRDLTSELEQETDDPNPTDSPAEAPIPELDKAAEKTAPRGASSSPSREPEIDSLSSVQTLGKQISDLWTRLMGSKTRMAPGQATER